MAAPRRRLFLFFWILFAYASSESLHDNDSSLKIKHQHLLSKILNLESSVDERSREINSKDERIKQLEMIVLEKSNSLTSLHSEIQSLQKQESFYAKEVEGEAHARASELLKQVENLKAEISKQNRIKETLEAQIHAAETRVAELNVKLQKLQRINQEQKIKIRKTEDALQKAKEERIRDELNAARYSKQLAEALDSWLPSWLAVRFVHYQSILATHWNVYGRPTLDIALEKTVETQVQVRKWGKPYIDDLHTKWIPYIKDKWLSFVTNTEQFVHILTAKTVQFYGEIKKTLRPHISSMQTTLDPYIKGLEARKFTKPYINQLLKIVRPRISKVHIFVKPYTKKILRGYRRFSRTALKYHRQVRAKINRVMKENEFTRPLASNEVVWFMATAFMVFPVMVLLTWLSSLFSEKPRRRNRTRRRAKRAPPESI